MSIFSCCFDSPKEPIYKQTDPLIKNNKVDEIRKNVLTVRPTDSGHTTPTGSPKTKTNTPESADGYAKKQGKRIGAKENPKFSLVGKDF